MNKHPKTRRFLLPSFDTQDTKWGIVPAQTTCDAHVIDNGVPGRIVYIDGICMFFEAKEQGKGREIKGLSTARFLSLLAGSSRAISAEHHKFFKENRYVTVKIYEGALHGLIILEMTDGRLPDFAGAAVEITSHPDFTEDVMMTHPDVTMDARKRIAHEMFKACIGAG